MCASLFEIMKGLKLPLEGQVIPLDKHLPKSKKDDVILAYTP